MNCQTFFKNFNGFVFATKETKSIQCLILFIFEFFGVSFQQFPAYRSCDLKTFKTFQVPFCGWSNDGVRSLTKSLAAAAFNTLPFTVVLTCGGLDQNC